MFFPGPKTVLKEECLYLAACTKPKWPNNVSSLRFWSVYSSSTLFFNDNCRVYFCVHIVHTNYFVTTLRTTEFTMKKWCRVSEKSPSILFLFPMRTTNTMQWGEMISMEHFYFKPTIKLTVLSLLQFLGGFKAIFQD